MLAHHSSLLQDQSVNTEFSEVVNLKNQLRCKFALGMRVSGLRDDDGKIVEGSSLVFFFCLAKLGFGVHLLNRHCREIA